MKETETSPKRKRETTPLGENRELNVQSPKNAEKGEFDLCFIIFCIICTRSIKSFVENDYIFHISDSPHKRQCVRASDVKPDTPAIPSIRSRQAHISGNYFTFGSLQLLPYILE